MDDTYIRLRIALDRLRHVVRRRIENRRLRRGPFRFLWLALSRFEKFR